MLSPLTPQTSGVRAPQATPQFSSLRDKAWWPGNRGQSDNGTGDSVTLRRDGERPAPSNSGLEGFRGMAELHESLTSNGGIMSNPFMQNPTDRLIVTTDGTIYHTQAEWKKLPTDYVPFLSLKKYELSVVKLEKGPAGEVLATPVDPVVMELEYTHSDDFWHARGFVDFHTAKDRAYKALGSDELKAYLKANPVN